MENGWLRPPISVLMALEPVDGNSPLGRRACAHSWELLSGQGHGYYWGMARMFHALVVLGSGLAGCGGRASDSDVVDRQLTDEMTNTDGSSASDDSGGSASDDDSATSDDDSGSDDTATSGDDGNTDDASDDDTATDDAAASTDDASSADDEISTDGGSIVIDQPSMPVDLIAAPRGPDDCPSAQWQCVVEGCQYERAPACGEDWDETIESCLVAPSQGCACAPEPAPQPGDCESGEVYTCVAGWFESSDSDAGAAELLPFDCRCVLRGDCSNACNEHPVSGYNRSCVEEGDLVLCGGCIWTGILR